MGNPLKAITLPLPDDSSLCHVDELAAHRSWAFMPLQIFLKEKEPPEPDCQIPSGVSEWPGEERLSRQTVKTPALATTSSLVCVYVCVCLLFFFLFFLRLKPLWGQADLGGLHHHMGSR